MFWTKNHPDMHRIDPPQNTLENTVKSLEKIRIFHNPGGVDECSETLVEHIENTGIPRISPTGWLTKANPSKFIAKTSVKQMYSSVPMK